jgi:hypothetical protein
VTGPAAGRARPLALGLLAAVPGAGAVGIAAVHAPVGAELWVWVGAAGVVLAVHPALRWASTLALAGVLVTITVRAGVSGLPLAAAAGLGVLMLAYLLALDLAEALGQAERPIARLVSGWAEAVSVPAAAGLGAVAFALVVAAISVPPSLPLALAGPVAVVILAMVALRMYSRGQRQGRESEPR